MKIRLAKYRIDGTMKNLLKYKYELNILYKNIVNNGYCKIYTKHKAIIAANVKRRRTMAQKYLTIMEVSQKQAFIFASNRLKKNVENSNIIAWIMDPEYFEQTIADPALFTEEKNLVYSGGGHTVLQFDSKDIARNFTTFPK